jgi:subtilase family serine protease
MFRRFAGAARRNSGVVSLLRKNQSTLRLEELGPRTLLSTAFVPAQIRHAYGFDTIAFSVNGKTIAADGTGQTIAIVDAFNDPKITADLAAFDTKFNLPAPPSFNIVGQTGGQPPKATDPTGGWEIEVALDVEWAHAIAPGANILLVEANSASNDLFTAVDFARKQAGVSVVSMSWGGGESASETTLDKIFTTPQGHNGVTFVASSGDNGSKPSYPALSPNVVAVGGTTLKADAQGNYQGEVGWSGSGGGFSSVEKEPSYQNGVQKSGKRSFPDVSYDADPASGFEIVDTFPNNLGVPLGLSVIGGTSAGAPQWSALIAVANQGRALNGLNTLDGPSQTLPAIYSKSMISSLHDITSGSNGGFKAHKGYDEVTGLGTPKAKGVVTTFMAVPNKAFNTSPAGAASPNQSGNGTPNAIRFVGASSAVLATPQNAQPASAVMLATGTAAAATPTVAAAANPQTSGAPTTEARAVEVQSTSADAALEDSEAAVASDSNSDTGVALSPMACDTYFAADSVAVLATDTSDANSDLDGGDQSSNNPVFAMTALAVVAGGLWRTGLRQEAERIRRNQLGK